MQKSGNLHTDQKAALTFDVKPDGIINFGLRVDLTLVNASVSSLHEFHLQIPVIAVLGMVYAEPPVARVRVDSGR